MDGHREESDAVEMSRLDGILAWEEEIVPSSGFLAAVMEQVEEEARMPAPIPFPWKRAIPGMVLVAVVFGGSLVELVRVGIPLLKEQPLPAVHLSMAAGQQVGAAGWVAVALGVSLASWLLARLLAGRTGLL
jgi:hypothetical protein